MNRADTPLEILTLGRFSMTRGGQIIAPEWPGEKVKILFCSLLSPLDLYLSWDRICRSLLGVPETETSRQQMKELLIRPLNAFLLKELGFNPLLSNDRGVRIDQQQIHVDAFAFHHAAIEGVRLFSLGQHLAAFESFSRADSLYIGNYLPGISGKIIDNTRIELESLYRTAVLAGVLHTCSFPPDLHSL